MDWYDRVMRVLVTFWWASVFVTFGVWFLLTMAGLAIPLLRGLPPTTDLYAVLNQLNKYSMLLLGMAVLWKCR